VTSTSDHALLAALSDELSRLFDVALMVEPPGMVNDAWGRLLAEYGVRPVDPATREVRRRQLALARGALPEEVGAVVHAIAAKFARAINDRSQGFRPPTGEAGGVPPDQRLIAAAAATWKATEDSYLRQATSRPKSMFAFAIASAKAPAWQRPPGGFVARCKDCGGPRLDTAGHLRCDFCGSGTLET
jgi:hypothetical protein